jgi:hypothetical protein
MAKVPRPNLLNKQTKGCASAFSQEVVFLADNTGRVSVIYQTIDAFDP